MRPRTTPAILNVDSSPAEVLTVDFFKAFMDDPWTVGRVAALNAMSDVWAMGGRPTGAMAMVSLPDGSPRQQTELLYQLLAGSLHEFNAAETELLGGHTIESGDGDPTVGFTIVGSLAEQEPLPKGALRTDDVLILTKAIGTGVLLAAHMQSALRATWMETMLREMLLSNAAAADVARQASATAATDVTGFGLAGHLLEMLDAAGLNAEINLSSIPRLSGFAELNTAGIRSSLDPANRSVTDRIQSSTDLSTARSAALFDPQTSGGMLLAVSPDQADETTAALRAAGYSFAAAIGHVGSASETPMLHVVD